MCGDDKKPCYKCSHFINKVCKVEEARLACRWFNVCKRVPEVGDHIDRTGAFGAVYDPGIVKYVEPSGRYIVGEFGCAPEDGVTNAFIMYDWRIVD